MSNCYNCLKPVLWVGCNCLMLLSLTGFTFLILLLDFLPLPLFIVHKAEYSNRGHSLAWILSCLWNILCQQRSLLVRTCEKCGQILCQNITQITSSPVTDRVLCALWNPMSQPPLSILNVPSSFLIHKHVPCLHPLMVENCSLIRFHNFKKTQVELVAFSTGKKNAIGNLVCLCVCGGGLFAF